jgi:hypothetical protein
MVAKRRRQYLMKSKLLAIVCIFVVTGTVLSGCSSGTETLEDALRRGTNVTNIAFDLTTTIPDMPSGEIKMWIKGHMGRMDFTTEGQTVVLIFDTIARVQYTYIPAQKVAQKALLPDSDTMANFSPGKIAEEILRQKPSVSGTETIDGKATVKIQGTGDNGEKYNAWISKEYGIPLKLASAEPGDNMVMEWKNIDLSTIPDSIFEIPADVQIILPDTTTPTVGSTSPAPNSTGIMVNIPITATFSEEMNASAITTSSFTLKSNDKPVSGKVTYTGNTATFTPTEELTYSTEYTVTVTKQATDLAGNGLPADYAWTFKTRDAGILEGALNYIGEYPEPALVTYTDKSNKQLSVTAYPGQIQVFYDSEAPSSEVETMLVSKGGTILGRIPLMGYYLVQVPVGQEDSFITTLQTDAKLKMAIPNIALSLEGDGVVINEDFVNKSIPVPLNITGPVLVDAGDHADELLEYAEEYGGEFKHLVEVSDISDGYFGADRITLALAAIAQGSEIFNPGKPVYLNLSNGAGARVNQEWVDYKTLDPVKQQVAVNSWKAALLGKLQTVDSMPEDLGSKKLVISQSAGNSNMPIGQPLQEIRNEYPKLGLRLRDNLTIYSSDQSPGNIDQTRYPTGKMSNSAPDDKDVVKVSSPLSATGESSLWSLIGLMTTINSARDSGVLTPDHINAAIKISALANSQRQLNLTDAINTGKKIKSITEELMNRGADREEVQMVLYLAYDINVYRDLVPEEAFKMFETMESLTDTDPTAALWVTGITVTTENGVVATATITPAVAGVTIQYKVTSNLGRNILNNVKTDASGRVSFTVPAGECEEVYTYTVTAILSNKTATIRYMFYY